MANTATATTRRDPAFTLARLRQNRIGDELTDLLNLTPPKCNTFTVSVEVLEKLISLARDGVKFREMFPDSKK